MLSELLMNEKMKSWAKMEFAEIFYSAIIIPSIVGASPITTRRDPGVDSSCRAPQVSNRRERTTVARTTTQGPPRPDQSAHVYQYLDICGDPIASDPATPYTTG